MEPQEEKNKNRKEKLKTKYQHQGELLRLPAPAAKYYWRAHSVCALLRAVFGPEIHVAGRWHGRNVKSHEKVAPFGAELVLLKMLE